MDIADYAILFSSIVLSGMIFYSVRTVNPLFLKLSLSFTGAFLFAITVTHLIPAVYKAGSFSTGIYVLAGFFIQIIIEFFSEGIEHGHIHKHSSHEKTFPAAMMLGLGIHSFLEGMPLSGNFDHNHLHEHTLLTGIVLHHIPVAFALTAMLHAAGLKPLSVIAYLILFASMAPLGALFGSSMEKWIAESEIYFSKLMAIVIGIFLHISTTILFEYNDSHRFNFYKLMVIVSGALAAIIIF